MEIDWIAIKTEYCTTGIGQRKLAKKYGIPFQTLRDRAKVERWYSEKQETLHDISTISVQKTADAIADREAEVIKVMDDIIYDLHGMMCQARALSIEVNTPQVVTITEKDGVKEITKELSGLEKLEKLVDLYAKVVKCSVIVCNLKETRKEPDTSVTLRKASEILANIASVIQ